MKLINNKHKEWVPCIMENVKKKITIQASSLSEFCRMANLRGNDKYHITPIIYNQRLHHKHWYSQNLLNKVLELKDCYGNNYVVTVRELLVKHKIGACGIKRLINNRIHKGLYPKNVDYKHLPTKNYTVKKYIASKGNRRYVGKTLEILGDKLGYTTGGIWQILAGRTSHSDIKFVGMETEKKSIL